MGGGETLGGTVERVRSSLQHVRVPPLPPLPLLAIQFSLSAGGQRAKRETGNSFFDLNKSTVLFQALLSSFPHTFLFYPSSKNENLRKMGMKTNQATLQEFLRSRDGNEMMGDLSEGLEARRDDLVCPDPSRCYPKTAEDRAALQSGSVVVKGYRAKVRYDTCAAKACAVKNSARCPTYSCGGSGGSKIVHSRTCVCSLGRVGRFCRRVLCLIGALFVLSRSTIPRSNVRQNILACLSVLTSNSVLAWNSVMAGTVRALFMAYVWIRKYRQPNHRCFCIWATRVWSCVLFFFYLFGRCAILLPLLPPLPPLPPFHYSDVFAFAVLDATCDSFHRKRCPSSWRSLTSSTSTRWHAWSSGRT